MLQMADGLFTLAHAAHPHLGQVQVKERVEKFDDESKTMGYTILEGDPRYSHFSAEMQFVPVGETTEAIWTAKYEPVGDMGPPEHIKAIAVQVFKTFERAVMDKKTMTHTEVLGASPDAIWKTCKHVDEILPKAMPQFFASTTMLQGHGEPGSIRVVKMGPGKQSAPSSFYIFGTPLLLDIQVSYVSTTVGKMLDAAQELDACDRSGFPLPSLWLRLNSVLGWDRPFQYNSGIFNEHFTNV